MKDSAGDPVAGARVALDGYAAYSVSTGADGKFEIADIFEDSQYTIGISKNRHLTHTELLDMTADRDLGEIVLADNVRSPRHVEAVEEGGKAIVNWTLPANDPVELRYDDGTGTLFVGLNSGTVKSTFGVIYRVPGTLHGVDFYIGSTPTQRHYDVKLYVFDLDEDGNPTSEMLYKRMYVPVEDDTWNTYMLDTPVEAPRGCYVAIATDGNVCLGIDGDGDRKEYPFMPRTNCFSVDYESGEFMYLEEQDLKCNFMMRSHMAPYDEISPTAAASFVTAAAIESVKPGNESILDVVEMERPVCGKPETIVKRAVEDRLRYDVYRFAESDEADMESWTKIAGNIRSRELTDTDWASQERGIYRYAVAARYDEDHISAPALSDIIGRDMHTALKLNVYTNTPENESAGTEITLVRDDERFEYTTHPAEDGVAVIPSIWKGVYNLRALKAGYEPLAMQVDLSDENAYSLTLNLVESLFTPVGLKVVDDGVSDQRLLVWNVPALIKDSFEEREGHEVFTNASAGYLEWNYYDGDGAPTGALNIEWPHQFEPQSWMTFNPYLTEPSGVAQGLMMPARDGDQCLMAISSNPVANDDWLISPRLYFTEPFQLNFYASGWNPYAPAELIQIGYSTSDMNPESFKWLDTISLAGMEWNNYHADFDPDVNYVAVRYVKQNGYMAFLDDFRIGDAVDIMMDQAGYYNPETVIPVGPAEYEITLNGNKIATTDKPHYLLTELGNGDYRVAVRQVYKSGYSGYASAEFSITDSGVESIYDGMPDIMVECRMLRVCGGCDKAEIMDMSGLVVDLGAGEGFDLRDLGSGIYVVRIYKSGSSSYEKIVLK